MGGTGRVIVFEEKKSLVEFAMGVWHDTYEESVAVRGHMTVALSGGETPVDLYLALARKKENPGWEDVHIFLVDERFVPLADKESNYGTVREAMLDALSMPEGHVHPIVTEGRTPGEAAEEYEEEMQRHFLLKPGELPRFDLVILGLGEDGHTASLFPGSPVLGESKRLSRALMLDSRRRDRITLTLPVINNARRIIFLVCGSRKAAALKGVVEDRSAALPASHVIPGDGSLYFLVDREAARLLTQEGKAN